MAEVRRILIVEDERDIQDALTELLTVEGFQVTSAYDGGEALERFASKEDRPDLILLDLMMPGVSGLEFLKRRSREAEIARIPVVVMTADARPEGRIQGLGVAEYLRKPLDIDQLLTAVSRYFPSN